MITYSGSNLAVGATQVFDVTAYGAVGDGVTNSTNGINNAIAVYNAAGGGTLLFPPGNYRTVGGHIISKPGTIVGAGYGTIATGTNGTTVVTLINGSNVDMFTLAAKAVTVRDIGLYGNVGGQTGASNGLVCSATTACNYLRIERVWIDSFYSDGLLLQGPGVSLEAIVHAVKFTNNGAHGLNLLNGSAADSQFTDCIMNSNTLSGAYVNATDAVFTNCHMWGNGSSVAPPIAGDVSGLFMPSGAGGFLRITGGYYESNGNATAGGYGIKPRGTGNIIQGAHCYLNRASGLYAFSNTNLVVTGGTFRNNNLNGGGGASGSGVFFDTCTASSVIGCQMFDTQGTKTQTYGYAENGNTCTACVFADCVSRASDHVSGAWLIGSGNPVATKLSTALSVKEGTNALMGTATLAAGTVTVANTSVTANTRIFLSDQGGGTLANLGSLEVSSRVAGTSFTVTSSNALDNSTFAYLLIEPA